ncbi:hypothetical protein [Desulfoluna spongiiphila]|uniref:Uncharacterized protein n=1 Tax=Desulfoluna spongiiphila TaxID=419481 RepID=A0A1G5J0H7_9BACT|nr:hypothetical protein [Desulfoluna spongiiphila]SCY81188.1 hypothetical protein SAMN05216233_1236 [Desulfoluna spongiiphila]
MQFRQISTLKAKWKVPFIVLLVMILSAWGGAIYIGMLHENHGHELLTPHDVELRSQKADRNTCTYISPKDSEEIACSGLNETQNAKLNKFLQSELKKILIESHGSLLEAAKYCSDNYIKEGVFFVELGGGVIHLVVVISSIVFTAICIFIAIIVLFISLPIFLKSDNENKAKRAGGIVKTCLGFIVASGTTLVGGFVITSAMF